MLAIPWQRLLALVVTVLAATAATGIADAGMNPELTVRVAQHGAVWPAGLQADLPDPVVAAEARSPQLPSREAREAVPDAVSVWECIASWYGPGFVGRRTANGETFDPDQLTAAHKTLPFGTELRVTFLRTGKSVIVRINDRGPFVKGREIDLSRAAAEAIGMTGVGRVRIERLS